MPHEMTFDGIDYIRCDIEGDNPCENCPHVHECAEFYFIPQRKTEAIAVEDVQGYDGADEMFKLRRDTQRVTGSLERDVALLQENQRNVARALIPLERNVADFEKELEAIRAWLGRESDCLRDISTQVHRAIDRMVLVEGDGKLIIRLEDARK